MSGVPGNGEPDSADGGEPERRQLHVSSGEVDARMPARLRYAVLGVLRPHVRLVDGVGVKGDVTLVGRAGLPERAPARASLWTVGSIVVADETGRAAVREDHYYLD